MKFHWIYFFLLAVCISSGAYAQDEDFIFSTREISIDDGLSNSNILSIYQAKNGLMWIGTKYGLNRYNGHNFEWFTKEKDSLKENFIHKITEDDSGLLWLLSTVKVSETYQTNSISLFDPSTKKGFWFEDQFSDVPFLDTQIKNIYQLSNYKLLIQLQDNTHFLYSTKDGFKLLPVNNNFEYLNDFDENKIWGTFENELVCINPNGKILQSIPLPKHHKVFKINQDTKGRIWALTGQKKGSLYQNLSIQILNKNKLKTLFDDFPIDNPNRFRMLLHPKYNTLFLVCHQYLIEIDQNLKITFKHRFYEPYEISYLNQFLMDSQGTIWNGTTNGIQLINYERLKFRTYLNNLDSTTPTRGIMEYGDNLIVNSSKSGFWIDKKTGKYKTYNNSAVFGKMKAFPISIQDNKLWVANNALHQLDSLGNVVRSLPANIYRNNKIWSFIKSKSGLWWVGQIPKLYYFDPEKHGDFQEFKHLNGYDELNQTIIWQFLEDEHGIWLATMNGLFLLDETKGILAKYADDQPDPYHLPASQFTFIWRETENVYWLTTDDGGLIKMMYNGLEKQPVFEHVTRTDGLPTNQLYAVFPDDYGKVWISSANGIIRMDKSTLDVDNVFFEAQGIAHNECNKLSYYQSETGEIYFGGLNGVTAFYPKDFISNQTYDAPLIFSDIKVFSEDGIRTINEKEFQNKEVVLHPKDLFVRFNVSLQDYFNADKINYTYSIKGLKNYQGAVNDNSIEIGNLPFGVHELEIRGTGPNATLSSQVLTANIIVLRPFYLQWWFIGFLVLIALASIWYYNYWRLKSLRIRQLKLERMVSERTEELRKDKKLIESQAQKLVELDTIKSRFFENISHELRTPLTLILGPIHTILSSSRLEQKDQKLMHFIHNNAKILLRETNELLDLSKLDSPKKIKLKSKTFNLYDFAVKMLSSYESEAKLKHINLQLEFELDRGQNITTDEDKLGKIVYNYLSNAIKFSDNGDHISLSFKKDNTKLIICVSDTGYGIPEKDHNRIFKRFYTVNQNSNINKHGVGIGLSLCKELAEFIGGKVWVKSKLGEGSQFFVSIPLLAYTQHQEKMSNKHWKPNLNFNRKGLIKAEHSNCKILIVEDNIELLDYLTIILETYRITKAEDGQKAVEHLSREHFDLIITDIMMPNIDGIQLLQYLKTQDQFRYIPVIMLTAKNSLEDKLKALRIGVDDYLTKPFNSEELLVRVENLLSNSLNKIAIKGTDSKTNKLIITEADQKWLKDTEELILSKIDDFDFSVEVLAGEMALSIRRLQQKIKSVTGLTPNKYIRQIKLEYIRRQLEAGKCKSVADASYSIGINDQYYFSKIYKEQYGRVPSSYF